jgi:hypothetical protein
MNVVIHDDVGFLPETGYQPASVMLIALLIFMSSHLA